ncbi:MAG TPA: L,D-transpeptidase [Povalibacter sp.]|uniref:L,D-transpeptidase n=1 Tax=Povalibacter sp. TaxID=1962978 RepID=UPI002C21AAF0|nr:L,D-transpeptidase [Povalibacter sp.]HMN45617.1 L,D-transpeptidase [Povalibacter sp.]
MKQTRNLWQALLLAAVLLSQSVGAVPIWGARQSQPADTPPSQLKHGEWIWLGDAIDTGPMVMVVNLSEQRAYVYRNGVLIGVTTVSTGRPGHETPTGVFTILQKDKDHRSTIYDSAPMPYMQRLTWGGVALHAGGLPGYPESHGCVHLPSEFARLLFDITSTGMTVVVEDRAGQPQQVPTPGFLAPVTTAGAAMSYEPLSQSEQLRWTPEASLSGPVSIVISRGSGRVVVYRNGVEIGRARAIFTGAGPVGTHALILAAGPAQMPRYVPDPQSQHWLHVGIAGDATAGGTEPDPAIESRLEMPPEFVRAVFGVLTIGSTVLITDEAITPSTTGETLDVVNADPPET